MQFMFGKTSLASSYYYSHHFHHLLLFMAALWNGAGHYIFFYFIILSDSFVITVHGVAHLLVIEKSGKVEEFYF